MQVYSGLTFHRIVISVKRRLLRLSPLLSSSGVVVIISLPPVLILGWTFERGHVVKYRTS